MTSRFALWHVVDGALDQLVVDLEVLSDSLLGKDDDSPEGLMICGVLGRLITAHRFLNDIRDTTVEPLSEGAAAE